MRREPSPLTVFTVLSIIGLLATVLWAFVLRKPQSETQGIDGKRCCIAVANA